MAFCVVAHVGCMLHFAGIVSLHAWARFLIPALLMLMGNFLPRVRPNYFAGLRTPWTLSSETVWRRTNRLGGKLLFYGGLATAVLVFFVKTPAFGAWALLAVCGILNRRLLFRFVPLVARGAARGPLTAAAQDPLGRGLNSACAPAGRGGGCPMPGSRAQRILAAPPSAVILSRALQP